MIAVVASLFLASLIAGAPTPPPSPACSKTYTVKDGDYCYAIAMAASTDVATLESLNPAINGDCTNLMIGQVLCLPSSAPAPAPVPAPAPAPSPACSKTYTVKDGDYCYAIAMAASTDVATLESLNPAINGDCTNLAIGQILCLARGH